MVKQGYRQTEIGVIPDDWKINIFKNVGNFFKGAGISMKDVKPIGLPCIMYGDIYVKFDTHFIKCDFKIDEKTARGSTKAITNDLFFTASGETAEEIGKCVSYQGQEDIYIGGDIIAIRPYEDYNSLFLAFVQNSSELIKQKASLAQGHTVVHINKDNLASLLFAHPTLDEQKRIAEALSDVDSMISSLEKLIAKKKAIKQGAMQELLTCKKRLPGFSGEWEGYTIGKMGEFYSGLSGKSKKDFDCGEAYYITFLNVLSNVKIDTSILASVDVRENESQNAVRKGDLFFNTSSETPEEVGMCAVLDEELENTYLNSFCFGFRLFDDTHDPLFLSYYLNSAIGRKIMSVLAQGATRYNLSKNNFAETVIKLPVKEEQTAIASTLSDMDNEIEALKEKLEKTRQVKQGMMQELLTGRIRLV